MKITIDLPDELWDLLADLCREEGMASDELARRLLLDRIEDFEDEQIVRERLDDPQASWISLEEVMREHGLVDEKGERIKPAAE